ncbi:MAG: CHASE2 domain-containing protein [Hyphomicrobiaceae bacterium]
MADGKGRGSTSGEVRARRRGLNTFLLAVISAAVVTAIVFCLTTVAPALLRLEHWTADWRTALLSDKAPEQHARIAVVVINDDTLADYPYTSPIDRHMLSELVRSLDRLGVAAVGFDLLFLKPTEPDKDKELIKTLAEARARIVLGIADQRVDLSDRERAYQKEFLGATGRAVGYINLHYDQDNVVRSRAGPAEGGEYVRSFSALIAETDGAGEPDPRARIAWLLKPADTDTFFQLPAQVVLAAAAAPSSPLGQAIGARLKGRLILVGGIFADRDAHTTPLAEGDGGRQHGVFIHAQMIAELLDHRSVKRLDEEMVWPLIFALALLGFPVGWFMRNSRFGWWNGTVPTALLVGLDLFIFQRYRIILPFTAALAAWFMGNVAGFVLGKLLGVERRKKTA